MQAENLIAVFGKMYSEKWRYEWGAAREGCVDCSGAFVYAFKVLGGGSIYHGSNTIYRMSIGQATRTPKPGYAAFKVRSWTEKESGNRWYGTAPGDVYHIGLVDESGKWVLNAKGVNSGFCRDKASGFQLFAPLSALRYDEEEEKTETKYKARVKTNSGALSVREGASTTAKKIGSAPKGAIVSVYEDEGEWMKIGYCGITGYASAAYLERAAEYAEKKTELIEQESGAKITLMGVWTIGTE